MARGSSFEDLARDADARLAAVRSRGEQMELLPSIPDQQDGGDVARRGKGKAQSTLREWLALRGFGMPEDQLAQMAGLRSRDDVITWAKAQAEELLAWQYDGAVRIKPSGEEVPAKPTAAARGEAFKMFYMAAMRAAEAMLPYGVAKVTPDVSVQQSTTIVVAGGAAPGHGSASVSGGRTAPPPLPGEIVEHQQVSGDDDAT